MCEPMAASGSTWSSIIAWWMLPILVLLLLLGLLVLLSGTGIAPFIYTMF